MQHRFTLKKAERLNNKNLIRQLFLKNHSFVIYPFKVIFCEVDKNSAFTNRYPAQVLFTVSKKKFRLAVDRNKLKRLMRESYRKNKHEIYEELNRKEKFLALGFIYTGKNVLSYHEIEKKIKAAILRLKQELELLERKNSCRFKP